MRARNLFAALTAQTAAQTPITSAHPLGVNRAAQRRTVSYETPIPRSASKSSTSRKLSVNRRVEPDRVINDLGREPVSGVADLPHARGKPAYQRPTS
jgi:hypothetical protein